MKMRKTRAAMMLAAAILSGSAVAAIDYSENFEGFGNGPTELGDAGWLVFGNVFTDYPGCSSHEYGYGPFPAPNGGPGFSAVVDDDGDKVLNVYSDYNNGDHAAGKCIESNVFQERNVVAADAGEYTFAFDVAAPAPPDDVLGANVTTYAFIKLINPNNGYSTDLFLKVDTSTPGSKSINANLDSTIDGKILQWGFASTAGNYATSGRWYDNVSFAEAAPPAPPPPRPEFPEGSTSIPTLGFWGLMLLLALVGAAGVFTLSRRS